MPRKKKYKFLGPWLRKIRISQNMSREDVAKALNRHTENIGRIERGDDTVPSVPTLRAWLSKLKSLDMLEQGKKLLMIDGDYMQFPMAKLTFEERLRVLSLCFALCDRQLDAEQLSLLDDMLFSTGEVEITRYKDSKIGSAPKECDNYVAVTKYKYDCNDPDAIEAEEFTYREYLDDKDQQQTEGEEG